MRQPTAAKQDARQSSLYIFAHEGGRPRSSAIPLLELCQTLGRLSRRTPFILVT